MREIAERITEMRLRRLRKLVEQAGLDPHYLGIHLHNAWAAYQTGKPWKGVDYSLVRKARALERSLSEPDRILEKWDRRVRATMPK